MIQGIHLATQGMSLLQDKQDQIANNLANINTTGFKQSHLFVQSYQKYLKNNDQEPFANQEVKPDDVFVDYSEGVTKKTGNDLDVLIKGSGFFTVMTPDGMRYTRNGNFSIDFDGYLVTSDGSKVMATEGFIRLEQDGGAVRINLNGEVLQGDKSKGILQISDFKKPYRLLREGNSYFRPQLPDNPVIKSPGGLVKQGFLEGSNANPIQNMVEMIQAFRNYEADQKALQAQDQTLDRAINSVGRIG